VYLGGLGFGLKWNMGWMHDTLEYLSKDPVHRKFHQNSLTFSLLYAFHENFVLSLSHDEVVYGKRSLLSRMPGDDWQRRANLRLLLGYLYTHPGKKLLFMGGEFGQYNEWNHEHSLDWNLLDFKPHRQLQQYVRELNAVYRSEPALYKVDFSPEGFSWISCNDWENSVISFLRKGRRPEDEVIVACNFTPVPRFRYDLAAPTSGPWHEVLNSDAREYGGSGIQNPPQIPTTAEPRFGLPFSLTVTLPPLGVVILKEGHNS
jgi:1,4-alpha-glucan branching enzyme